MRRIYEESLNGTEIKSVERLNSLSGDTKYSFLQHGAFIFSTDEYAIWLPRTADRLIICLPEDSVIDAKLDGRQAKKALFDFATKANQMRFLKCENILMGI